MTFHDISGTMNQELGIFDEGITGGPSMFHLQDLCTNHPREFQKLQNEIEDLLTYQRGEGFYELDEEEKERLVGFLLNALDDQSEWFMECKDVDMIMSSLGRFMRNGGSPEKDYFVSVIKANAIKYWGHHLHDLICVIDAERKRDLRMNYVDNEIERRLAGEII